MTRDHIRVLRFLSTGAAQLSQPGDRRKLLLDRGEGRCIGVEIEEMAALARRGLVNMADEWASITAEGLSVLRRAQTEAGEILATRRHEISMIERTTESGERETLSVNLNESPLAQIARRKDRRGRAFLCDSEVRAGERLRADYTRGQLMPRMGVNWDAAAMPGRGDGVRGVAELTQAALAARMRVEKAVVAVGPELAGVLLDVCCYLKGLETVEMERCWPVRSAKIVLKAALSALARHYEPPQTSRTKGLHWGADDYRPNII